MASGGPSLADYRGISFKEICFNNIPVITNFFLWFSFYCYIKISDLTIKFFHGPLDLIILIFPCIM